MNIVKNIMSEFDDLESKLTREVAELAAQLEALPDMRNTEELNQLWRNVVSTRRRLANFLKSSTDRLENIGSEARVFTRHKRIALKTLKDAKDTLRIWGRMDMMVTHQIMSEPTGLFEVRNGPPRQLNVLDHIVAMCIDGLHQVANPTADRQEDGAHEYGCHRDIPLPMSQFADLIGAAHRLCLAQQRTQPIKFLDVGAGGGTKVLAAKMCFDICDGLEYEKSSVETGNKLLELLAPENCKLIHGDGLFFENYGDYDVIYFYRPLSNYEKMIQMEQLIIKTARPGTVLLIAGGLFSPNPASLSLQKVADQIYIAGISEKDAAEVVKTAEKLGDTVRGHRRRVFKNIGYWKPLADVSERNGYYL